jgi:hypothetical protein
MKSTETSGPTRKHGFGRTATSFVCICLILIATLLVLKAGHYVAVDVLGQREDGWWAAVTLALLVVALDQFVDRMFPCRRPLVIHARHWARRTTRYVLDRIQRVRDAARRAHELIERRSLDHRGDEKSADAPTSTPR